MIVYGTAWKEDATADLVRAALAAGYRAFDTANQRKHYFEEAVGAALRGAAGVWIQTKFTYVDGQDHRLPYDRDAPIGKQVEQSYRSSLAHLGHVDSLVLHGPSRRDRLGPDDHEAWRAMEGLGVAELGISNVTAHQVDELAAFATRPIAWVQNRCHAARGWDADVRDACARHGIRYQGFSLLTANRQVLADAGLRAIAARIVKTPAQVVLRFAQLVGMVPLTGTRDPVHMAHDLALDFDLDDKDLQAIGNLR